MIRIPPVPLHPLSLDAFESPTSSLLLGHHGAAQSTHSFDFEATDQEHRPQKEVQGPAVKKQNVTVQESQAVERRASPKLRGSRRSYAASSRTANDTVKSAKILPKLPPCPGPQLHAFKDCDAKVEWLERLDEDREGHSGMQGYIFRVQIKSRKYAVKVFKDFDVESIRYYWEAYLGPERDLDEVAYYTDPFFCECRAYGRIQDALEAKNLIRNPALPCYGYMLLQKEDETLLRQRGIELRYSSEGAEASASDVPHKPIRALVKKLASTASGVTTRRQAKICMDMLQLNALKIYNRDIRADNYKDGLLVDFGSSLTEPHIILDKFHPEKKKQTYQEDIGMYKGMLDEEDIELKVDPTAPIKPNVILRQQRRG